MVHSPSLLSSSAKPNINSFSGAHSAMLLMLTLFLLLDNICVLYPEQPLHVHSVALHQHSPPESMSQFPKMTSNQLQHTDLMVPISSKDLTILLMDYCNRQIREESYARH